MVLFKIISLGIKHIEIFRRVCGLKFTVLRVPRVRVRIRFGLPIP